MNPTLFFAAEGAYESHHWLLPETFEIIYGGLSSVLVISALVKFAGPLAKKALAERTARIQNEIDSARSAKANADIASASSRVNDELRAEITRLSAIAVERVVTQSLDDKARQNLIESFISNVGSSR